MIKFVKIGQVRKIPKFTKTSLIKVLKKNQNLK